MKKLLLNVFTLFLYTTLLTLFCSGILYISGYLLPNKYIFALLFSVIFFLLFAFRRFKQKLRYFYVSHLSIHRIDRMDGIEFEEYLQIQFKKLGLNAEITPPSADYGADIILQKKKHTIAVQVKRYNGNIGVKAIQEVIGSMAYYEADKGLVVSNSYYTKNAETLAEANNIILWDRDVLLRLIAKENMSAYIAELLEN